MPCLLIQQELSNNIQMEGKKSFERQSAPYTFTISLEQHELQIVGRSPKVSFGAMGKYSYEQLPEQVRSLAESIELVYDILEASADQYLKFTQNQLKFGVSIGQNVKIFGIPLLIKQLNQPGKQSNHIQVLALKKQLQACNMKLAQQAQRNAYLELELAKQRQTHKDQIDSWALMLHQSEQNNNKLQQELKNALSQFIVYKLGQSLKIGSSQKQQFAAEPQLAEPQWAEPQLAEPQREAEELTIKVKTMDNAVYEVEMKSNQTISDLKKQLIGIKVRDFSSAEEIKITLSGRVVANEKQIFQTSYDSERQFFIAMKKASIN